MDETRVVLVKAGDTLVFGNIGILDAERADEIVEGIKSALGVDRVAIFEADIDIDVVPRG